MKFVLVSRKSKRSRVSNSGYFIQTYHFKPQFLNCNVNGDKSWVFQYHPETKWQRAVRGANSPLRLKTSTCKSQGPKSMLIIFYL